MTYLRHLFRFVFAATLLVAALMFAPAGAQAHAGHDHAPVRVESTVPTPHIPVSAQVSYELKRDARLGHGDVQVSMFSVPAEGKGTLTCTGGCCQSAGHGCCAAALPDVLTVGVPLSGAQRLFARFLWGPGITPGALPEPPRSLV